MKIGFIIVSIVLFIQGMFGLFGFEVWIRNKGWIQITFLESLFFIVASIIIFIIAQKLHNK